MEKWIKKLLEACEYDVDYGDPDACIDDIRSIVRQMEIEYLAGDLKEETDGK